MRSFIAIRKEAGLLCILQKSEVFAYDGLIQNRKDLKGGSGRVLPPEGGCGYLGAKGYEGELRWSGELRCSGDVTALRHAIGVRHGILKGYEP